MSDLYICVDCEVTSSETEPTEVDTHGMCKRCGSSSVIPVSTLKTLVAKTQLEHVIRETPTDQTRLRWQAIRDQRRRDAQPLVDYLRSIKYPDFDVTGSVAKLSLNRLLEEALTEWDGWYYNVHYPWSLGPWTAEEHPIPGSYVIELIQGASKQRWLVVLAPCEVSAVTSFQK